MARYWAIKGVTSRARSAASVVVSKFAISPISNSSRTSKPKRHWNQIIASVLRFRNSLGGLYRDRANFGIGTLGKVVPSWRKAYQTGLPWLGNNLTRPADNLWIADP